MKLINHHLWHVHMIGAEGARVRVGIGWERLSGCKVFKPVKATPGWRGGCLWLWRVGFGVEWR